MTPHCDFYKVGFDSWICRNCRVEVSGEFRPGKELCMVHLAVGLKNALIALLQLRDDATEKQVLEAVKIRLARRKHPVYGGPGTGSGEEK